MCLLVAAASIGCTAQLCQPLFFWTTRHRAPPRRAEAWGILGGDIADTWRKFNGAYFNDALRPIPLVISQTLPFGKRIGQCSHNPGHYRGGRAITLNLPACGGHLIADNGTLLHEMLHQYLFEGRIRYSNLFSLLSLWGSP
jgi:hypothetical protein